MKTFGWAGMVRRFGCSVVLAMLFYSPSSLRAQLVADGQSTILDGVGTNIADNVTVGTNGSFTLLIVTNGAAVTNSGTVYIGANSPAANNRFVVGGAGSTWYNTGSSFDVGFLGSSSELDILDGGTVTNIYGYIGAQSPSSNNTALVSGPGSLWRSAYVYLGQSGRANNLLIVSNGAQVISSSGTLGTGFGRSNTAIVTGVGSVWTNNGGLSVGAYGSNSLFIVTNGGTVFGGSPTGLGMLGASSVSNVAVVTDPGSKWSGLTFYAGGYSSGNQLKILNGGTVSTLSARIGENSGVSNNLVLVDGPGSLWTNSGAFLIGNSGAWSTLILTNGGKVKNVVSTGLANVANGFTSSNNTVLITGAGSAFNCGVFNLGNVGPGGNQLRIEKGGMLTVSVGAFALGPRCNSNLLVLTDTNSLLQCNGFHMGNQSTNNVCVVSNGAMLAIVGNQGNLINGTYSLMTITGAGSLCSVAGDMQFGGTSDVLALTGGGALIDTNGSAANTVIVADTNSVWKNFGNFHWVGVDGELLITNGGTLVASNSFFAENSNNTALISGSGSLWTNRDSLYIGSNGPNSTVTVTDSGAIQSGPLFLGENADGNQLVVSNGGTVTARGITVGDSGGTSNSVTVAGGTITVLSDYILDLSSYGTLTINSGVVTSPSIMADFFGPSGSKIVLNGGTLQSGETYYDEPAPFVVGDGTDTANFEMLSGDHYFPGGMVISNNGLLKGSGKIHTNVTVDTGGTIAPGSTNIGKIAVFGSLALDAGATAVIKLNALSGAADSLTNMGGVYYGGTLQVTNIAGSLAAGNFFKLFSATNYFGAFDTVLPAPPGAGLRWDTNELNIDGVLRVFSTTTAAPALRTGLSADGNVLISATGGIAYDPCYLLTCTNFPPGPADWTYVATNYFDATGATSFTNAISAGEPQRYFRVQVN